MQAIIDFFTAIGDMIVAVVDFVISFFGDLIYMIQLTAQFLGQIPSYFSWLPGELLSMVVVIFSVVVIYKVLGREG